MENENKINNDINLQGNTITNITLGTNNDMSKPGSLSFENNRICYTDDDNIQEILTLNDLEDYKSFIINNL